MSKQTISKEIQDGGENYDYLIFVEFLEFIGRLADFKFEGSELESLGLGEKIEHLLDELFIPFEYTRKPVSNEVEEISESDSEY